MSKNLHDYELKYSKIEKKYLSLVKEVDLFRTYIFLTSPMKMLLSQQLREEKWVN
jgi:hypothetical protein